MKMSYLNAKSNFYFFQKLISVVLLLYKAIDNGRLLLFSAITSIIVVNSRFSTLYYNFIKQNLHISFGNSYLSLSLQQIINELLMSIFFLLIAMEIKREIIDGHLKTKTQRIAPILSACFGVIFPITIYITFNYHDNIAIKGWAIPAATDIAFVISVFVVFGKNLPLPLRVFVTALAIIDDFIAILIITFFYSGTLRLEYLFLIILCCVILYLFNRLNFSALGFYLVIGLLLWYYFFKSGIHSTISGIILGIFIPFKVSKHRSPLKKLEKILVPYVKNFILPLFAFANSGISFTSIKLESFCHPVILGIVFGLSIGKTLGISFAVYILKICHTMSFPNGITMKQYCYASMLCGIGFTMSLFISLIAFSDNLVYFELAKIGIIFGSLISVTLAIVSMKIFGN